MMKYSEVFRGRLEQAIDPATSPAEARHKNALAAIMHHNSKEGQAANQTAMV